MANPFEKYVPEIAEQKKKFEKVFGKEVSKQLEKESQQFAEKQVQKSSSRRRRSSGGGSSRVSTPETPTPSASDISGSAAEKEQQIKEFQQKQAAEAARKKREESIQYKSKQPSVIDVYKPLPKEERMKGYQEGYRSEFDRPATAEELRQAGFQPGFKVDESDGMSRFAVTPSGRGTVMQVPTEKVPIGDIATFETESVKNQIKYRADQIADENVADLKPKFEEKIEEKRVRLQDKATKKFNDLQEKVNKGKLSVSEANEKYQKYVDKSNKELEQYHDKTSKNFQKKVNEKVKKEIDQDPGLKDLQNRYNELAAKYEIRKDVYGKEVFGKFTKTAKEKQKEKIKDIALYAAAFTPQTTPFVFAAAAKEGEKGKLIIKSADSLPKDLSLLDVEKTPKEKELLLLGTAAAVTGGISKGVQAARTEKALEKSLQKVAAQKANMDKLRRLGLDKKVKLEAVGSIEEKQIKRQLVDSGLVDRKVVKVIDRAEIGKATRVNVKTLKPEVRNIVKLSRQVDDQGKEVFMTFKLSKQGKIKTPRILVSDLKKKESLLFRPAQPKELSKTKIKVKDMPSIEVQEVERLKQVKAFKTQADTKKAVLSFDDTELRILEKDGFVTQIGGKGKGTLSEQQIQELPKTPIAYAKRKPTPISKFKSKEIQLLKDKKGLTYEELISEEIPKPVEYEFIKPPKQKIARKVDQEVDDLVKRSAKTYENLVKSAEKKVDQEIARPSYVGGEGGQASASAYQLDSKSMFAGLESVEQMGFEAVRYPSAPKIKTGVSFSGGVLPGLERQDVQIKTTPVVKPDVSLDQLRKQIEKEEKALMNLGKSSSGQVAPLKTVQDTTQKINQILKQPTIQEQALFPQEVIPTPVMPSVKLPKSPGHLYPAFDFFYYPDPFGRKLPKGVLPTGYQRPAPTKAADSAYTASLAAAAFDIQTEVSEKDLKKLNKKVFSGFELRPLLKVKKKKKKKRK